MELCEFFKRLATFAHVHHIPKRRSEQLFQSEGLEENEVDARRMVQTIHMCRNSNITAENSHVLKIFMTFLKKK